MKTIVRALFSVCCLVLLAGCASPAARIKRNPEKFAGFPPDVQAKVQQGKIDVGYSKDMVYIALGDPDKRYLRRSLSGEREVWAYVNTYTSTERQRVEGPYQYRDANGVSHMRSDTIWVDVQQQHEYERLRVEFEGGIVTTIDELQR